MSVSRPSCSSYSNHVPRARTIGLRSCSHAVLISADFAQYLDICTATLQPTRINLSAESQNRARTHAPYTRIWARWLYTQTTACMYMYIQNKYTLQEPTSHVSRSLVWQNTYPCTHCKQICGYICPRHL